MLPTKVSIAFYANPLSKRARMVQWLQRHEIYHCGIMLEQHGKTAILASDKTHCARMIAAPAYERAFQKPTYIIELGEALVSIEQVCDFISTPYRFDARSVSFWYYIGRWLFPSNRPNTCSALSTSIARMCGFKINDFVIPRDLYNHLKERNIECI